MLFCLITLLLIFNINLFAENPDTTLQKINKNINFIKEASERFNIDYKTLCSVIFVERTLNYNWEDDALDEILADAGMNSSIGFCQVKMKTAYWIEKQLSDSTSKFYSGKKYENILKLSKNPKEIILKLKNDSLNILYAAAYIKIMKSRWKKEGYPINNKPEIIGTLYSTGLFYANGEERKPNKNPKANDFGMKIKNQLNIFDTNWRTHKSITLRLDLYKKIILFFSFFSFVHAFMFWKLVIHFVKIFIYKINEHIFSHIFC